MKRHLACAVLLILSFALLGADAPPTTNSVDFFYNQLAPYGTWVHTPAYGWAWSPSNTPIGWRPYNSGNWVDTDAGMAWVSDEAWGDITYHYGRWLYDPDYGWLWIPGSVWSPGWVAWRRGGDYVGWAPLPPDYGWSFDSGLDMSRFDYDDIDYFWWNFVGVNDLFADNLRDRIQILARNDDLERRTENVTRFREREGRVHDESLDEATLARAAGHAPTPVKIRDIAEGEKGRAMKATGGEIGMFRPAIGGSFAPPPPEILARQKPPAMDENSRQATLDNLLKRQQADHVRLNDWHGQQLSAGPSVPREQIFVQQRIENRLIEEQHNREMRQFENRFSPRGGGESRPAPSRSEGMSRPAPSSGRGGGGGMAPSSGGRHPKD